LPLHRFGGAVAVVAAAFCISIITTTNSSSSTSIDYFDYTKIIAVPYHNSQQLV
jgi:hypothetical protein